MITAFYLSLIRPYLRDDPDRAVNRLQAMLAMITLDTTNCLRVAHGLCSNRLWTYERSPGLRKDTHPNSNAKRKRCAEKGGEMEDTQDLDTRDPTTPSEDTSDPAKVEKHRVSSTTWSYHPSGQIQLQRLKIRTLTD